MIHDFKNSYTDFEQRHWHKEAQSKACDYLIHKNTSRFDPDMIDWILIAMSINVVVEAFILLLLTL